MSNSYSILGCILFLQSNNKDFLHWFDMMYGYFKIPNNSANDILCSVSFRKTNEILLEINGKTFEVYQYKKITHYILRAIFTKKNSLLPLHAGVVAKNQDVYILAGTAGVGKTTLTMKLVEKGFHFFSDDLCLIDKVDGLVHPFPRSLAVVCKENRFPFGDKKIIQPEVFSSFVGGEKCKIKYIICLDTNLSRKDSISLRIVLKNEDGIKLIQKLKKLDSLTVKSFNRKLDWCITYSQKAYIIDKITALLGEYERYILYTTRENYEHDFSQEPELHSITYYEAAFWLLQKVKYEITYFSEEEKPDPKFAGKYFMELVSLISNARCYKLKCGKLDATFNLLYNLP